MTPKLLARIVEAGLSGRATALLKELLADHEAVVKRSARRGRARGGGQSSKAKGRLGAQMAQSLIVSTLGLEPDDVLVKAGAMGGVDLHLSPAAQRILPFGIESKRVEALNIWDALAQAEVNARKKGLPGLVFFSRSHSPLYVALDAAGFLALVKEAHGD